MAIMLSTTSLAGDVPPSALGARAVRFTYEATVTAPGDARIVDLWVPIPHEAGQTLDSFDIGGTPSPEIRRIEPWGDRVAHLHVEAPTGPVRIVQHGRVRRPEYRAPTARTPPPALDSVSRRASLAPTPSIVVNDEVRAIAARETAGKTTVRAKARALYDWVYRHMEYDKSTPGWGLGDIPYCLRIGKGNCTDFHSLFMALARASDIPTRWNLGFPLAYGPAKQDATVPVQGYHCWAEFWDPEAGWVPVDISEARKHPDLRDYFFGSLSGNRILFTRGRDLMLGTDMAERQNYLIYPVARIDGVPYKEVTWSFTYQDE